MTCLRLTRWPGIDRAVWTRRAAAAGWSVLAWAWLAAVGGTGAAHAAPPSLSGELATGVWSSDRLLDDRTGVAVARLDLRFDWSWSGNLRLRADAFMDSAPERLDGRRWNRDLRELYLEARRWPCAPALGQRLVIWGRADGINPTDQVAPTDYLRLAPEAADQRLGSWGLHLDCRAGGGRLRVHLLDRFELSAVPLAAPPGTLFRADRPRARRSVALRYERLGSGADWSVSFIDGYDLLPTLAIRDATPTALVLGRDATAMRQLGADVALVRGAVAWRGEAALTDYRQRDDPWTAHRYPHASFIGGAEWALGDLRTFSVQGFWRRRLEAARPANGPLTTALQQAQGLVDGDLDANQYGATLRYAQPLFASRGNLNLFAVRTQPRGDWMLRGRVRYALTDALQLTSGFDLLRGPRQSYLGHLRPNSLWFAELGYAW